MKWPAFLVLITVVTVECIFIDGNEIVGVPEIQCSDEAVTFTVKTKSAFRGNIYVRGHYNVPQCRQEYFNNDYNGATFTVRMGDCGMSRVRQLEPHGMNYVLVFVANFHPTFVTKLDRAFSVRCFYAQADKIVTNELEIGDMTTEMLEQATMIMPTCEYTLRSETLDGPTMNLAHIGDQIVHRWECDNANYGMLVKNCYVTNGAGFSFQVIDARGCPLLTPLIQQEVQYNSELNLAFATVSAYAFPDASLLNFQCQIQVCNKREDACTGITPPNCPSITKKEFMPSSVINTNVNPTQVIATFEESTQIPTTVKSIFTSLKPSFIPKMEQNQFTSNQPFQSFPKTRDPFPLSTPGDFRRSPVRHYAPVAPNMIQTERIEALQNFHRPYFRRKDSPPPVDSKNDSSDAILHFGNDGPEEEDWKKGPIILKRPNRSTKPVLGVSPTTPSSPSTDNGTEENSKRTRTRRDEEETLDVVAAPLYIVGDPEAVEVKSPDSGFHHPIYSPSELEKARYCIDKFGIIAIAIGFALLSTFSVSTAIYILIDIVCSRRKKGLIADSEPRFCIGSPGRIRSFNSESIPKIEIPRISPKHLRVN